MSTNLATTEAANRSMARVLTHPVWIGMLALLALNDHVLKGSGLLPGSLTGKLSDVAGMFVAPPLLALLFRVKTARGLLLAHLAVGAGFAALEMSLGLTAMLDAVYRAFGLRWVSTRDVTDLLVLGLLPLAYTWAERVSRSGRGAGADRRRAEIALAGAGLLACVATSYDDGGGPTPFNCGPDCDGDGWDDSEDCNDFDPTINPGAKNCPGSPHNEHCDNGVDDNGDGYVDCDDPMCSAACADTRAACEAATTFDAQTGVLQGSTLYGTWALEGSCGGADAPENVYAIYAPSSGTLTVVVPEGHVAYVRGDCSYASEFDGCVVAGGEPLTVDLGAGSTSYLVIDASDGLAASDYEIDLTYTFVGCGDGVYDPSTESCDDGNHTDGDGCSAGCSVETEIVCGSYGALELGTTEQSFEGAFRFSESSCAPRDGYDALERGYTFTAAEDGVLTARASTTAPTSLGIYAKQSCQAAVIACAPHVASPEAVDLALPLLSGETVILYVEGEAATTELDTFTLEASFAPN